MTIWHINNRELKKGGPFKVPLMKNDSRLSDQQLKDELIRWRTKVRKIQREAIYKCLPGKLSANLNFRNVNDTIWDVILFIALNGKGSVALTASDIYLGTEFPKRTVIRIIDKLEALNVVHKTTDDHDRRVTHIGFSPAFAKLFDRHLDDCFADKAAFFQGLK